jgi:hypothetical protein
MIEQHLYNGDSADVLKRLKDKMIDFNSILSTVSHETLRLS